jgi:hypothetical protein
MEEIRGCYKIEGHPQVLRKVTECDGTHSYCATDYLLARTVSLLNGFCTYSLSITGGFQLKFLGLSRANAVALIEVRDNAASARSVSKLSTKISKIHQTVPTSITALGTDIQTSIHDGVTEPRLQSATKVGLLMLAEKFDQATLGLESEIKALLDIEPITQVSSCGSRCCRPM